MILSSEITETDATQMLEFYKQHFAVVDLVSCSQCKSYLAFECSGGADSMGLAPNEIGKYIIPIGDKLQSSRVRLDEAPTGERMVGYQCECGNDTRIAEVEKGLVPVGGMRSALSPFEKHSIREKIKANRTHKPDFKVKGNIKHFESFQVERT